MSRLKTAKSNHTEDESNASNLDLSLLRRPITTSVTGFEEAIRAYNDGTNELKKLISKECDLIYECKVCRNIFRSLTNFISHKRVYCRSSFNSTEHFHFRNARFSVQDISSILETEQNVGNNPHSTSGILASNKEKSKDLGGVVEHILYKQHQSRNSTINDVYDEIDSLQLNKSNSQSNNETLLLNPVNNSDIAVYQSLQSENDRTSIKEEIIEVHNMENKSNTVLGPDGKIIKLFASNRHTDSAEKEDKDDQFICKICNFEFETEKTLKLHLEMKHLPSAYVYQCPSCSQNFSSSAAVLKHLSSDHKKSNRRIRLMRDNIIKKRVRADEVSTKSNASSSSRELLQLNSDTIRRGLGDVKQENGSQDDSNVCPSCLKKFDRKAVYMSHVQMCSDIKDREQEKLKKRQAKDGAKMKQQWSGGSMQESEESSNVSEQKLNTKRNRKVSNKKEKVDSIETAEENSEDIVDWNLDDDEEKGKLENIKKEIIEDEYKRSTQFVKQNLSDDSQERQDDEENSLVIDEKPELGETDLTCPTCQKVFGTTEKLKYHLTFYHSRQKRFKCKMCEYQGYRKKDTMNHINFVHGANVTLDTLCNYTETVSKAVNEEDVKIQNELKKNQLKIKRKMARERKRKRLEEARLEAAKVEKTKTSANSNEEDQANKSHSENDLTTPPKRIKTQSKDDSTSSKQLSAEEKSEIENELDEDAHIDDSSFSSTGRETSIRSCKLSGFSNISRYGKVVKNVPFMESLDAKDSSPNSRPIRNRIKPVRKDFLYDLSDLLKKEADAHREQSFQSSNVTIKRELRKRAMSTHVRETPNISTFDQTSPTKKSALDLLTQPIIKPTSDALKDQRNRRMSVFVPPTRSMFPPQPRSPPYRPPATHKNAGSAYKMALKEHDNNRVSMYEPKFLWTICFEQETEKIQPAPSSISAASSILQRLSSKTAVTESKPNVASEKSNSLTAEQLCKKFELINVTNMNELDISMSNRINLNPGSAENNLISLNLGETSNSEICVLQECESENDEDDDSEPKLEIENGVQNHSTKRSKRGSNRKSSERRKSANGQRRLTVMQRLQENKIRKSREQLFQRLIHKEEEDLESNDLEC